MWGVSMKDISKVTRGILRAMFGLGIVIGVVNILEPLNWWLFFVAGFCIAFGGMYGWKDE